MATLSTIPVSEYLATSYSPDRDYIDGEVRQRNLGETPHAGIQAWIASLFIFNQEEWGLRVYTEQRVQVSATRFRVPDVCAIRAGRAQGGILRNPPMLCVEVLSPGDTLSDMQERVDDYLQMGVEAVWLIDPVRKIAWTADDLGIHPLRTEALQVEGTPIRIPVQRIYRELDRIAAGD